MAASGKVKPVDPQAHTTKPVYHGDDIALGISFQMQVDQFRSVAIQTHVTRDCPVEQLNGVFDRCAAALDRLSARYALKELKILLAQRTKAFGDMVADAALTEQKWAKAWTDGGRRGEFRPDGNQSALRENWRKAQFQVRDDISGLELRIADMEKQIGT